MSPALEFDFDTAELDLLALDAPDDQPGGSNIDQGNELPAPFHPSSHPNPEVLFTDSQLFTLEDDEAPSSLEAEPLSPLELPTPIAAAVEAAMEDPAADKLRYRLATDCAPFSDAEDATHAPAPCDPLTRRQAITLEINTLESQVVEYSETEYELAEKVSQVRKWRKEALENLRALKWQLNAMSDEDAEKPVETKIKFTGKIDGVEIGSATLTEKQLATAAADIATNLTIDHGGQQSITALGVTPKQLEKFEIEGIRTVSQFERALADRSIENVRGIQERTLDKLRESLWEFRKANPIPDPDDRPVLTASERDAKMEATEAAPTPTVEPQAIPAEQPAEENMGNKYRAAHQSGQVARRMGIDLSANPIKDAPFLASHWEDGWREEDEAQQEIAKRLSAGAKGEPSEVSEPSEATESKPKATRKPRAKKAKAEAGSEATDGTDGNEATTEATKTE
jgi:hypothetical protein